MKVRIKKVPKLSDGGSNNKNEFVIQNKTNNTLNYKTPMTEQSYGKSYPTEDLGMGDAIAEKGEMILKPQGIFKIQGKTHKKGGTDIKMDDGDFIFSHHLTLSGDILKSEFDLNPEKEYTFADIAKKYQELNRFHMLNDDPSPIVKKTGELMVQKYKEKLAKLALLQEQQKDFPNGIPDVVTETFEPQEKEEFKLGGQKKKYKDGGPNVVKAYKGDKNGKSAARISTEEWQALAKRLDFQGNSIKEFQEFLYKTPEYAKIIDEVHASNPTRTGEKFDDMLGIRWDGIYEKINKIEVAKTDNTTPTNTPVTPDESIFSNISPDATGQTKKAGYKDLGYSSAENMAFLHALGTIPSFAPTRQQNYGLEQAQGIVSNVMPLDYTSVKNEAARAAQLGLKFNRGFSSTPQAMANNALISGQLANQNSNIEMQEYNANANQYNNSMNAIGNIVTAAGADREQQAGIYDDKVVQMNENKWANRRARDKQIVQEYANAKMNRSLRNAYAFLGESVTPNFNINNADGAVGFTAMSNPFDYLNAFDSERNVSGRMGTKTLGFNQFKRQFEGSDISNDKLGEMYINFIKATK